MLKLIPSPEALFSQSVDRLRKFTMSDERRQVKGKVVDVNIFCNNPDILDTHYDEQLNLLSYIEKM